MRTTPAIVLPGGGSPTEPFTVEVGIGIEDQVATALFCYRDLFAAAHQRGLYAFGWMLLVLVLMAAFQAWQAEGRNGIGIFASRLGADLLGLGGLPLLFVAALALIHHLARPTLVRRRLRNWYRDEGLGRPLTVTHRFGPGGIVSCLPGQSSAVACRRIAGVASEPDHLFIMLKDLGDALALPRRALSGDQVRRIEAWGGSCHAGAARVPPLPELDEPAAGEPLLAARFVLTEADRAAELGWQMERRGAKRRRRRGFALAFLVAALIPPLVIAFLWLIDPARVPLRHSFPLFVEMFATHFWKWTLGFWAAIAAVMAMHPWLRRMHARQVARRLQQRMQACETEARFFEDRLETRQNGLASRLDWSQFTGVERLKEHILLRRRDGEPLGLPLRALEGEGLAILDGIVDTHIGGGADRSEAR